MEMHPAGRQRKVLGRLPAALQLLDACLPLGNLGPEQANDDLGFWRLTGDRLGQSLAALFFALCSTPRVSWMIHGGRPFTSS